VAGVPPAGAYSGQDDRQPAPPGWLCSTGGLGCYINFRSHPIWTWPVGSSICPGPDQSGFLKGDEVTRRGGTGGNAASIQSWLGKKPAEQTGEPRFVQLVIGDVDHGLITFHLVFVGGSAHWRIHGQKGNG